MSRRLLFEIWKVMSNRRKGLNFYKKENKINRTKLQEIVSLVFWIFAVTFIAYILFALFGTRIRVIGISMEETLHNGQAVLVDKASYIILSPKRGDVVVFLPNGNKKAHYYVKRVVGLPGETVQIKNGKVFINGNELEEGENYEKIESPGLAEQPYVLGEKEYFVLGDNRNNSEDTRSGHIAAVKKEDMIGKIWFHFASEEDGLGFVR